MLHQTAFWVAQDTHSRGRQRAVCLPGWPHCLPDGLIGSCFLPCSDCTKQMRNTFAQFLRLPAGPSGSFLFENSHSHLLRAAPASCGAPSHSWLPAVLGTKSSCWHPDLPALPVVAPPPPAITPLHFHLVVLSVPGTCKGHFYPRPFALAVF